MVLFQALLIVIIQNVELKSNFSELGYITVHSCPKSPGEWNDSSLRLNCNDTHKYHCAPYLSETSQLYEFCYRSLNISKGNCIGIKDDGNINAYTCEKFVSGCPGDDYSSSEIHKYPKCLGVQGECFTEDRYCICLNENTTATSHNNRWGPNVTTTKPNCTFPCGQNTGDPHQNMLLILISISVLILLVILLVFFKFRHVLWNRKRRTQNSRRESETNESTEEHLPLVCSPKVQKTDAHVPDNKHSTEKGATDELYKFTLVDYTIEEAELFELLKRQCLHKALPEFKYLVNTRIRDKRIFKQRDENGCSLLHYAAQGGCIVILDEVLRVAEISSDEIHENTCIRGQNVLHFAIKYNNTKLAVHLFQNYPSLNNCYNQNSVGAFAPIHWVAWHCNIFLLEELKETGVDIWAQTKNGLNILDIACMTKLSEKSSKFCLHLFEKENIPDLRKVDSSGWNIAHYASKSNKIDLFRLIEEKEKENTGKKESLIMEKTNTSKTCLHIACEFAKYESVLYILTKFETILNDVDDLRWNALHYAAKGGNLKILKTLIKEGMVVGCLTKDGKTILHIACIHKHPAICKYAVKNLPTGLLNAKTSSNGLSAVHYLAVEKKEDGSETEILKILCKSKKIDLSATCNKGFNQLEWAIDHLNIELIRSIVSAQFRKECDITREILLKAKKKMDENPNPEIINILHNALKEVGK